MDPQQLVLNPLRVQRRGRPAGAINRPQEGSQDTSTQREPSSFEVIQSQDEPVRGRRGQGRGQRGQQSQRGQRGQGRGRRGQEGYISTPNSTQEVSIQEADGVDRDNEDNQAIPRRSYRSNRGRAARWLGDEI